jgi:hypothetical protein
LGVATIVHCVVWVFLVLAAAAAVAAAAADGCRKDAVASQVGLTCRALLVGFASRVVFLGVRALRLIHVLAA